MKKENNKGLSAVILTKGNLNATTNDLYHPVKESKPRWTISQRVSFRDASAIYLISLQAVYIAKPHV